ncbi:MAG: hypothetical protein K0R50_413 [Eubacterium sp.]|nr:hypothetical protein [Eubacterium sp.]
MACERCVGAMRETLVVGEPVKCQCDYCGARFTIGGKRNLCLSCNWFISVKTEDEGYRYRCVNNEADCKEECSGYEYDEFQEIVSHNE